ncbi:MAG: glycosyltransferase family 39 protein [Aquificaceae bacterium]|nr:glycosyltransferase family 39 protein [Aquificaceae bacterium]MCX8164313.1 glycosyltransferase family 39 protein [Aquificaceae bacterium]
MFWLIFAVLAFLSLLPNLEKYPFKNEESLRNLVAFEMWHSREYIQPTLLGEPYFNKPPLFNWLIVLYAQIFSWDELVGRMVSLTSLLMTLLLIGFFSYFLFKKLETALLSALIFITFGNVLFFYGYLAEIDMLLTFLLFLGLCSIYLWWDRDKSLFAMAGGLVFGFSALLKGFPSYAFLFFSLLALALHFRKVKLLVSKGALLLYTLSLLPPIAWLILTPKPILYLLNLWRESFDRVHGDFSRLQHFFMYPLTNLKDLLPWSLLFLLALYNLRGRLSFPSPIRFLSLLFLLNYIPYWFSNSAGRYILPLYPILSLIFSFYIGEVLQNRGFKKLLVGALALTVSLRLLYGLFYFPYKGQGETSRKKIARDMISLIDLRKDIACECPEEKSLCLYIGLERGKPLKRLSQSPNAEYAVACNRRIGKPVKEYLLKDKVVSLESLN